MIVVVYVQSYSGCKIVIWNLWFEWQALLTVYLCYIVIPDYGHSKIDILENKITSIDLLLFPKPVWQYIDSTAKLTLKPVRIIGALEYVISFKEKSVYGKYM